MSRGRASALALSLLISACSSERGEPKAGETEASSTAEPSSSSSAPTAGKPAATPARREPPPAVAVALPDDSGKHEGKHLWSRQFGTADSETARAIAVAPDGGIYVSGYAKGAAFPPEKGNGGADGYVARLSPTGELQWARLFGGSADDSADSIAVDREGNVVAAGSFGDKLTIGDGTLKSAGADDGFLIKFDPSGRRLWAKRIGGVDVDAFHHVAIDRDGNILATGAFKQHAEILGAEYQAGGFEDIFVIKLRPDGSKVWTKTFGAGGQDYARALAVDTDGNIVLLCEFYSEVNFAGQVLKSDGNRDIGLIKLSPAGDAVWVQRFGTKLDDLAFGLAVDPANNIAITGSFDDKMSFGGDELVPIGGTDIYVAKFDPNGQHLWSQRYGDKFKDTGIAIAADRFGNLYTTGWFWGSVHFAPAAVKSAGKHDIYVMKLSPGGDHLWSHHFGNKESDQGRAIAVDADGNAVVAGAFYHAVNFGGELLTAGATKDELVPHSDAFVAKFSR